MAPIRSENLKRPTTSERVRTFYVITCRANELVADIHDRMPVILPPAAYDRWLANIKRDPRDLLVPFPSELVKIMADQHAGEQASE